MKLADKSKTEVEIMNRVKLSPLRHYLAAKAPPQASSSGVLKSEGKPLKSENKNG